MIYYSILAIIMKESAGLNASKDSLAFLNRGFTRKKNFYTIK